MSSYATLDAAGGAPVELYKFTVGTSVYAYTSGDEPVTYGGVTYQPTVLKRDAVSSTSETSKLQLQIGLAVGTPLANLFVNGAAPGVVMVTIYRYQRANPSDTVILYSGQVSGCSRQGGEATILATPAQRVIEQQIPALIYQLTCNHALYDAGCGINPAGFSTTGVILTISADGYTLTVSTAGAQPDGYYNGGLLTDGNQKAFIELHTGTQLVLLNPLNAPTIGDAVTMAAGCDHTRATCIAKFDNIQKFLGFPFIPQRNPFQGIG
jgi:uncharacterized phage protein (TIGR02218 family)